MSVTVAARVIFDPEVVESCVEGVTVVGIEVELLGVGVDLVGIEVDLLGVGVDLVVTGLDLGTILMGILMHMTVFLPSFRVQTPVIVGICN